MLVEMWINENGIYGFYEVEANFYVSRHFFVLKNGLYDGIFDTLAECKEYTVDYDRLFGDDTFTLPK